MKKPVKKKNNTAKKLPTILGTPLAYEFVKTNPVSEEFIDHVCKKLMDYSRSDDALYVGCFIREMGIPHTTFYNWLKAWPQLAATYEDARTNIGYGRMQGAAKRHFDKSVIMHSQYQYGDEWKEADIHQAEMKKRSDDANHGDIKVFFPVNEQVIDREKYKPVKAGETRIERDKSEDM